MLDRIRKQKQDTDTTGYLKEKVPEFLRKGTFSQGPGYLCRSAKSNMVGMPWSRRVGPGFALAALPGGKFSDLAVGIQHEARQ